MGVDGGWSRPSFNVKEGKGVRPQNPDNLLVSDPGPAPPQPTSSPGAHFLCSRLLSAPTRYRSTSASPVFLVRSFFARFVLPTIWILPRCLRAPLAWPILAEGWERDGLPCACVGACIVYDNAGKCSIVKHVNCICCGFGCLCCVLCVCIYPRDCLYVVVAVVEDESGG